MRIVLWVDNRGKQHRSLVRDNDPDTAAPKGIPMDPPDVMEGIDWDDVARDLHNELINLGLFTWADVEKTQGGLISPILSVLKRRLIALYRQQEMEVQNER